MTFADTLNTCVVVHGTPCHMQIVNIIKPSLFHGLVGLITIFDSFSLSHSFVVDFFLGCFMAMINDLLLHLIVEGFVAPA